MGLLSVSFEAVKTRWIDTIRDETESLSERFVEEYAQGLAEKWDEIIDWKGREESESGFFEELLTGYGTQRVLDMACGTGFHAIHLAKRGFRVDAKDGSSDMLAKAMENANRYGVDIDFDQADWLELSKSTDEKYDAVICLGNALTHLFYEEYYRIAVKEVFKILKDGGVFIVDQRNYDALLDVGYSSKHQYYYCGEEVEVYPIIVQDDLVRFTYSFSENEKYYLTMHPIRRDDLRQYLVDAGFDSVTTYGDFKLEYDPYEPDFLIHVAEKKPEH